jgi:hypothetical protein
MMKKSYIDLPQLAENLPSVADFIENLPLDGRFIKNLPQMADFRLIYQSRPKTVQV